MNKKVILSTFGGIFFVAASTFLIVNLIQNQENVKKFEDVKEMRKEELVDATVSDENTTKTEEEPALQSFGIIVAPKICGPNQKLDARENVCKKKY